MIIQLPTDLESSVRAEVSSGHFASADAAVAEMVRDYFQRKQQRPTPGTGAIGALRDDAELLDQAVEHAMNVRETRPWRLLAGE